MATFDHGGGDSFEVGYDMLLGADGANSRVRSILEREVPDFTVKQREVSVNVDACMHGTRETMKTPLSGGYLAVHAL